MATYGGSAIFGYIQSIEPVSQVARQVNHYGGTNGAHVIAMGLVGGITRVRGMLVDANIAALEAQEANFRALKAAVSKATFVDGAGVSWAGVIVWEFRPVGRFSVVAGPFGVGYGRPYECDLFHTQ